MALTLDESLADIGFLDFQHLKGPFICYLADRVDCDIWPGNTHGHFFSLVSFSSLETCFELSISDVMPY